MCLIDQLCIATGLDACLVYRAKAFHLPVTAVPELPEVETIRLDLQPLVLGRTIVEAWVAANAPRLVQLLPPAKFCRALAGQRIEELSRRGKYLLFHLASGLVWVVHLRMTGSLQHHTTGCPDDPHLRARFRLSDGTWLCYIDLRKLGMMWLLEDASQVIGRLGPEPLREGFGPAELGRILQRRRASVKAVLLDQGAIAGLGNIYTDEALFAAKIDPRRAANSLSEKEGKGLHTAIRQVLVEALGDRGSSFRDYVDATGHEGWHQFHVKVFRCTGQPCYECGAAIQRIKVGGRSTHFCPRCQE